MNMSRARFLALFLACALAFVLGSAALLSQPPESFFGTEAQAAWQRTASVILSPVKILLVGPVMPLIQWLLRQDSDMPPPFILILFAAYWTPLALAVHWLLSRARRTA